MWMIRRLHWCVATVALAAVLMGNCSCTAVRGYWHYHRIRRGMRTARRLAKAHMDVYGNIPVVHLYGSPEEMGTQYGTLLRRPLQSLATCMALFVSDERKQRAARLGEALEGNLPDDIRTELKAIAAASGVSYATLVAANVNPNILCTALAVWDKATEDGELIFGRNSDYPAFGLEKVISVIAVYHPDEGNPLVSVNYVGMIGAFTGVNAKGVSFGNLLSLNAKNRRLNRKGMSIQLHLRGAAHQTDSADAFSAHLVGLEHLAPMNVMVADKTHAVVAELGVDAAELRTSAEGVLAATNHFRFPSLAAHETLCGRYRSVIESAADRYGEYGVEHMKQALFEARVEGWNIQSVIVEPGKGLLHVSVNRSPASAGPYTTFSIEKLIEGGGDVVVP
ncbi:hypothetical protein HQ560_16520 [bacterium]|nr:hypothetical protein [bacterium]